MEKTVLNIRLSERDLAEIKKQAEKHDITTSELVRQLIKKFLASKGLYE